MGTGHKWLEPVSQEGVHKGVDLQLTKGKPALSPVDGVVTDVGNDPEGLGITVTIRDAQGTETKLGHLDGVHVKKGDQVRQGQQVADVGETGTATGPHLDVRMQDQNGQFQDPTAMLGPLAQMPRADQPTGAGQDEGLALGDYAGYQSVPTLPNAPIPDEQRFWGGPQPQDQLARLWQFLQSMGPEAAQGWQQMLYGPQGPLAGFVGGGQDRYRVGSGQGWGGGGQGDFVAPVPPGGVYGAQKWSSPMGSNAVDIFVRRGTPVVAPTSGTIQQGGNGQLILAGDNGTSFAFRHGQTTAQGHVQKGQTIGYVNDPGLDSLGRAPWGNMPDNYQHLEMSVSRGSPNFPGTPGGGGNEDAAQWLNSIGYSGTEISKTPGPNDAQGGGQFGGMGGPGGPGGFNPMSMFGGGGGQQGMGGGQFGGAPMQMDPSMNLNGMGYPGQSMMGGQDPMAMGAGPMGDFSGWGGGGGASSLLGSFGSPTGMGSFGGMSSPTHAQIDAMSGQGGMSSFGGMGSQMQAPAFSGYPGAMPGSSGSGGSQGNPMTSGPADQLMLQNLQWKPDWTGVNDAQATLKKNATTPLQPFPINTNQLGAAPKSTLGPWNWLNQIYPGSGQDRAPVGSGQDRPGWAAPAGTRGWDVGVGAGATPTNTPFNTTFVTDPAQALTGNLNQQNFQLAQQQLQEQIQSVNQQFQYQQQQLAQQAQQFGMTTQLQQQAQELQQRQFDANQQLQRQMAELQNAQMQQNLGIQVGQFNQQMGLQGAQLGMQGQQFNQQMGLQGAQFGLQQQQLGMLPQQLAAQYGLSAAQLGQGQQQMGVQVQQLNQQYQMAQQSAFQNYLQTGNQDKLQRDMANLNAQFQQAQMQVNQAQYGGNLQLQQQQLRGQTGLSLAQMAQQQQQAGFGRQMDIFNSAMSEPWLQQLSGMSQQWGAPGGPQEAGQAAAAGMPNMPSQGGGINLPDLNQYFPDINVQQYLQGATPQVGASPYNQSWQQAMQGLGQYNPYGQSPITLPENPYPYQTPQFNLGQNPYSFNFQPVSSSFNFSPLSVPLEGQMPWAANPSPPDPNNPTNNTTGNPNGYQAGPLSFTGPGSMGAPPTGYAGGGVTYTLPNQQTFSGQDVWNWEQGNAGSSPDQAYQFEMGQHGFPGWNFPIGGGGGFPVGSTVGWNMGPAATGHGQDRVGSGQSSPLMQGDPTSWGMGPVQQGGGGWGGGPNSLQQGDYTGWGMGPVQQGGGWGNWGAGTSGEGIGFGGGNGPTYNPTDPWSFGSPSQGTSGGWGGLGWGNGPSDIWQTGYQGQNAYAPGGMDYGMQPAGGYGNQTLMQGDPTGWGMGPVQQQGGSGGNPLMQGDPTGYGMGPPQQGGGVDPTQGGGDAGGQPGGNTTGNAWQQYQQALQQWRQQEQAYNQYQQQYAAWQPQNTAYQQYQQQQQQWQALQDPNWYANFQQNFGQTNAGNSYDLNRDNLVDIRDYGLWRQQSGQPAPTAVQNPGDQPTAVTNPGAAPTAPNVPPIDFTQWLTGHTPGPYTPPALPGMPSYQQFAGMDPFQQAALRTQVQMAGTAWPQYQNQMRQNWGEQGVTQPPIQSPLTMSNLNNNTLNNLSFQNLLSVFGQTPQQYNTTYSPYWSQAQVPQVSGMMGGGY